MKKGDLSDFGMVVGLSISATGTFAHSLECLQRRILTGSSQREKALLIPDVRGEWLIGRQQITTYYNQGRQKSISDQKTGQTLKQIGCNSRGPHRVPLPSAKNRKLMLHFTRLDRRFEKHCLIWWASISAASFKWLCQHGSVLRCIKSSGRWWCNSVQDSSLALWAHQYQLSIV